MIDTRARSLVKSVIWRILGIVLLGLIVYLITGNWAETGIITVTFHGIRVVMYYYFERGWERVSWGRNIPKKRRRSS